MSSVLGAPPFVGDVGAVSPTRSAYLYMVRGDRTLRVHARGGIPSLERALGDPETASVESWTDAPADLAWTRPDPHAVLRALDRFHPIPQAPEWDDSWVEWLYFNGSAGDTRFYLTFLIGPRSKSAGRREAGVILQLDEDGVLTSFSSRDEVDEQKILDEAPDLRIGSSSVRLEGLQYRIHLDLPARGDRGRRVKGELTLRAPVGRSFPPLTINGAGGWQTGYVVPVLSGSLDGRLQVGDESISFDGGAGYHDHNWGHWRGVTWRWGKVTHGDTTLLYGRVLPPPEAADPGRLPGFLAVLGPDGPLASTTDVVIDETDDPETGQPTEIHVIGRGRELDVRMDLVVDDLVRTRIDRGPFAGPGADLDFFQMRATYTVSGSAAGLALDFEAAGSAETHRGGVTDPPG